MSVPTLSDTNENWAYFTLTSQLVREADISPKITYKHTLLISIILLEMETTSLLQQRKCEQEEETAQKPTYKIRLMLFQLEEGW